MISTVTQNISSLLIFVPLLTVITQKPIHGSATTDAESEFSV